MSEPNLPSFELEALHTLLEQEFDFLKHQDLKYFKALQKRKQKMQNEIVAEISTDSSSLAHEELKELIKEQNE